MKGVILAGGFGTRLYPLSTKEKPKQFLELVGKGTLFQQTVARLNFLDPKDIYVATNKEFVHLIKEQDHKIPEENIFIEPAMRNTATCIGNAAIQIGKKHPEEIMAVVYADHLVHNIDEFTQKLRVAEELAQEEKTLNIIEVEAKSPNVNLGYVEIGKRLRTIDEVDIYEFKSFKEKPDLKTAKKYVASGKFLWNTGFYVWRIDTILEKFRIHHPDCYEKLLANKYEECENISIDYAIMEKVPPEEVRIIPATLGWSDIGTWETLFEELEKNGDFAKIEKFKKLRQQ